MHGIARAFAIIIRAVVLLSYGKSVIQVKTRNLLNIPCIKQFSFFSFLFFFFFFLPLKNLVFQYIIR